MFIDNNISQGYKQTELGIIPEDWEVLSFSQVFDMYPNNTYPRDCMNDDHGTIRNIHYGDVLIKYPTVVDVDKCSIPYLNEGVKIKNQKFVQSGDVIIADTAEDETVGKCVEIKNAINAKIVAGLHTFFCRPIRKFAIGWLGYYLNSSNYHNQLLPYITGIKVSSISRGSIQETKLLVPPVAEQRAIAEALNDIDGINKEGRITTNIVNSDSPDAYLKISFYNQNTAFFASVVDFLDLATFNGNPLRLKFSVQAINNRDGSSDKIFFYTWYLGKEASIQTANNVPQQ